jgi:hypothetical protein
MFSNFKRLSFRHKNNKAWYYIKNHIRQYVPTSFFERKLQKKLAEIDNFDKEYIYKRVNYYNKLEKVTPLSNKAIALSELKQGDNSKVYFFDAYEFIRYFTQKLKAFFVFGDVILVPDEPAIVKSRPIHGENTNSVIMKLEKLRHFLFVNEKKTFDAKKNMIISRGKAAEKPHRLKFLEMYYNHPMCDVGQVDRGNNLQFPAPRMTISEHLNFKFIMCLEGNDVASNLKWVMSSNSLAVMPIPTYETWFMEGILIPNYHYVLIKDDYSDLEERMNYYIEHTNEALKIVENAHEYIKQFKNKKREDLISLLVIQKYFQKTGQIEIKATN